MEPAARQVEEILNSDENNGQPVSNGGPLVTNINTLVPDLRIASNQSLNIHPRHSTDMPPPIRAEAIQIIPGLPDRFNGKTYRLQIGAYSAREAAVRALEYLRNAGFAAEMDQLGSVFRVMAVGIPSAEVYSASLRLGALGFGQIWVRE